MHVATIKDIAKAAGVSPSTVSNVLNRRGNVSYKKIRLVEQAAKEMGYRLNEAASALRSGHAKAIAVLLPGIGSQAYADLYDGICAVAREADYTVTLHVTYNDPEREKGIISDVISSRAEFAVVVTSLAKAQARYARLVQDGTRVVFAERTEQDRADYIGFDMEAAAREIARRVYDDGARCVGLMTNMLDYPNEARFAQAFEAEASWAERYMRLRTLQTVPSQYAKRAFEFNHGGAPDALVTTNEEMAQALLSALQCCAPDRRPRVYALAPLRAVRSFGYERYSLNYRLLGRTIAQRLLAHGECLEGERLAPDGFAREMHYPAVAKAVTLNLLSIDSPHTMALNQLAPNLRRTLGIDLKILSLTTRELREAIPQMGDTGAFDLIRMDMAQLGSMGERIFMPLSALSVDIGEIKARLLPSLWQEFTAARGEHYTLPLDPSALVLFYRRDLIEDTALQRAFYERYKRPLAVPGTFEEWTEASEFFDKRHNHEARTPYGTALSNMAGEYIAHFAAVSQEGKLGDLSDPTFARALRCHRRLSESACVLPQNWWGALVDAFLKGECAFMMTYANHAERLCANPLSRVSGRVGHAIVPGGRPLLGGGVLGVPKASKKHDAAADMLSWLYSEEISRLTALISGTSPCTFAYEDEQILDIYPWLHTVRTSFDCGARRHLFGELGERCDLMEIENSVGFIVRNAMSDMTTPEQAMAFVAEMLRSR